MNISQLPEEVLINIFSYLTYADLCQATLVSRDWNYLGSNPVLWRDFDQFKCDSKFCYHFASQIFIIFLGNLNGLCEILQESRRFQCIRRVSLKDHFWSKVNTRMWEDFTKKMFEHQCLQSLHLLIERDRFEMPDETIIGELPSDVAIKHFQSTILQARPGRNGNKVGLKLRVCCYLIIERK